MPTAGDIIRQIRREGRSTSDRSTIERVFELAPSARETERRVSSERLNVRVVDASEQAERARAQEKANAEREAKARAEAQQKAIKDTFSVQYRIQGDEIVAVVTVYNNSNVLKEYRALLSDSVGRLISKEPDFSFKNIPPGASASLNVGTAGPRYDITNVGKTVQFEVVTQQGETLGIKRFDVASGALVSGMQTPQGEVLLPQGQTPPLESFGQGAGILEAGKDGFDFGDFGLGAGAGGIATALLVLGGFILVSKIGN